MEASSLLERVKELKALGKKIVFTNGCFDVLHPGHIHLLKSAKALGDFLIVGLNSDESVRRLKGEGRPIFNEKARKEILLSLRFVDEVIIFAEDTPERLIREIMPDLLVKGEEYKEEEIVGADFMKSYGGKVVRIPMLEGFSTSKIVSRILAAGK